MTRMRGLYRPHPRELAAWLVLGVVGFLLDGAIGLVPMVLLIAVTGARLERAVLGRIGVFLVALAGVGVLLDSTGGIGDVHAEFVHRSLTPHHLVFVGFTLLIVQVLGEVRPTGTLTEPVPEPLGDRSVALRIGLVTAGAFACGLAALGVLLT